MNINVDDDGNVRNAGNLNTNWSRTTQSTTYAYDLFAIPVEVYLPHVIRHYAGLPFRCLAYSTLV